MIDLPCDTARIHRQIENLDAQLAVGLAANFHRRLAPVGHNAANRDVVGS
jgi:hypothetical protein